MNDNEYSQLPTNKAELLKRIEREWTALEHAIQEVDEAEMTIPDAAGWSIKDNLAHLTAWERFLHLHHLRDQPPHEVLEIDAITFEQADEDKLNTILFERNMDRPVAEIMAELRQSHAQLLADLTQISFADLMKPRYIDDPEAGPLINWVIGNTYEHYQEHRATIERLIEPGKT